MEKIILLLITSIPIMYQIVGLKNTVYTDIQYIPMLILNLALIFHFYKNKVKLKKETVIIFLMLFMAGFVVPFVMSNVTQTMFMENLKYSGFYINFIVMIILLANYIVKDNYKKIIGSFLVGNTVILGINIIKNINNINLNKCIDNVIHLFKLLDKKEVLEFGFNHPNIASLFIIMEIFLLYKFKQSFDNRNIYTNLSINVCMIILIIPLLATGSRGAIIGGIAFCILNAFFWCFLKVKNYVKVIISTIIIALSCVLLAHMNFVQIIFSESMKIRLSDVSNLVYYLVENNKVITGLGPVNNTLSYAKTTGIENTVDNGYLAFCAQYGIIGLGLILASLGYLFYSNFQIKNNENCALILTLLIYSCVENVLFIPRVLMCLLVWIFIVNSDGVIPK